MHSSIHSIINEIKSDIEQMVFDIGQSRDYKALHSSALALHLKTAELQKIANQYKDQKQLRSNKNDEPVENNTSSNNTTTTELLPSDEIDKVARKLPKWASKPQQINSKILNLYLLLKQQIPGGITETLLREKYGDASEFDRNLPQMKISSPKNHGKVFEVRNGFVEIWGPVLPFIKEYEAMTAKTHFDQNLMYAQEAFKKILGVEGHPFGQKSRPLHKGLHDDNQGVQWSIFVNADEGITSLCVNLEGMKYDDWPIARLIEKELQNPEAGLPILSDTYADDTDVTVHMNRDAWQMAYRPEIEEAIIGGECHLLSALTPVKWREILKEAYDCLDEDKKHRGRATQEITLKNDGSRVIKEVSPHLNITATLWTVSPPRLEMALDLIRAKLEFMQPIYNHLVQNTA